MIDVILPVLNESEALPGVIAAMPDGYRPLVVDNGSTDGSGPLATDLGVEVVTEPVPGFGAACFSGLEAAQADLVCFMDCDGSFDPGELPLVTAPVLEGRAEIGLGRRMAEAGAFPVHARVANALLAAELRRRTGFALRDLGPMRAASRTGLLGLGIADRRFGWPLEMVLRAAAAGWRVEEVPVTYRARSGKSKVTGTVRGTARAIHDMAGVLR